MIRGLKKQVLQILSEYPQSRDDDQWLTLKLWCVFYPDVVQRDQENPYVYLRDIMDLPREDNVKRVRAIIQNIENKFLPTSLDVVKKRKINEEVWREYVLNQK